MIGNEDQPVVGAPSATRRGGLGRERRERSGLHKAAPAIGEDPLDVLRSAAERGLDPDAEVGEVGELGFSMTVLGTGFLRIPPSAL